MLIPVIVRLLLPLLCASPLYVLAQPSACYPNDPSPFLKKFVDPLPIPPTIHVSTGSQVVLGAYKISQKLHRDLPNTTLYGYGTSASTATFPGPTLEAIRGIAAYVRWENHIADLDHILTIDRSLNWANPRNGGVPIVTHLHGGEVESSSDGHPDAWFTAIGETGPAYASQNYTYPNSQHPTTLWYHDHAVGLTRLNVFAGLLGLYVVRAPPKGDLFNLPPREYEIPLIIQDKQFYSNGSFKFINIGDSPKFHPSWCPEFFGDTILVNGKIWPHLHVHATIYRFRLLNGANSRFFTLSLSNPTLKFLQIGTDGGFLPRPKRLTKLTFAPAERVDILIDFSKLRPGVEVLLQNSAPAPFPTGFPIFDEIIGTKAILKFIVGANRRNSSVVNRPFTASGLRTHMPRKSHSGALVRNLTLLEFHDENGNTMLTQIDSLTWTKPATETPMEGSVEVWRIINLTPKAHAIHVHLIQFRVLDTQGFSEARYNSSRGCSFDEEYPNSGSCFVERKRKPGANQVGWKDTVVVWPQNVTRLLLKFTTQDGKAFPFDPTTGPGYVWHCHMLDHEDNDMMRPLKIVKKPY